MQALLEAFRAALASLMANRMRSVLTTLGIVIGTLSSIFVACPLLIWLNVTKQDLLPKAKDDSELDRRP